MEYCDSGDLTDLIRARRGAPLPEDDVMNKFVQVCLALHYVHAQGVLHRDLKPSNVLVTSSGLLKLGDFGVSKISNTGERRACVRDVAVGLLNISIYSYCCLSVRLCCSG